MEIKIGTDGETNGHVLPMLSRLHGCPLAGFSGWGIVELEVLRCSQSGSFETSSYLLGVTYSLSLED